MSRKRKVVADDDEDPTKIEFETSEEVDVVPTFDQLKLREDLLRGVYAYGKCDIVCNDAITLDMRLRDFPVVYECSCAILGFEKPSAIQQRAIKPIVKGRDVIAQ